MLRTNKMDVSLSITQTECTKSSFHSCTFFSFVFTSLLARATAAIPFLKRKILDYIIFTSEVKNAIRIF